MKKCIQYEVIKNLRNIYRYINEPLPPSYERYARINCNDDFEKLACNRRFQTYIHSLTSLSNKYLEFKRIYHRLLIDLYCNQQKNKFKS